MKRFVLFFFVFLFFACRSFCAVLDTYSGLGTISGEYLTINFDNTCADTNIVYIVYEYDGFVPFSGGSIEYMTMTTTCNRASFPVSFRVRYFTGYGWERVWQNARWAHVVDPPVLNVPISPSNVTFKIETTSDNPFSFPVDVIAQFFDADGVCIRTENLGQVPPYTVGYKFPSMLQVPDISACDFGVQLKPSSPVNSAVSDIILDASGFINPSVAGTSWEAKAVYDLGGTYLDGVGGTYDVFYQSPLFLTDFVNMRNTVAAKCKPAPSGSVVTTMINLATCTFSKSSPKVQAVNTIAGPPASGSPTSGTPFTPEQNQSVNVGAAGTAAGVAAGLNLSGISEAITASGSSVAAAVTASGSSVAGAVTSSGAGVQSAVSGLGSKIDGLGDDIGGGSASGLPSGLGGLGSGDGEDFGTGSSEALGSASGAISDAEPTFVDDWLGGFMTLKLPHSVGQNPVVNMGSFEMFGKTVTIAPDITPYTFARPWMLGLLLVLTGVGAWYIYKGTF